jgi:hypothetical protein
MRREERGRRTSSEMIIYQRKLTLACTKHTSPSRNPSSIPFVQRGGHPRPRRCRLVLHDFVDGGRVAMRCRRYASAATVMREVYRVRMYTTRPTESPAELRTTSSTLAHSGTHNDSQLSGPRVLKAMHHASNPHPPSPLAPIPSPLTQGPPPSLSHRIRHRTDYSTPSSRAPHSPAAAHHVLVIPRTVHPAARSSLSSPNTRPPRSPAPRTPHRFASPSYPKRKKAAWSPEVDSTARRWLFLLDRSFVVVDGRGRRRRRSRTSSPSQ